MTVPITDEKAIWVINEHGRLENDMAQWKSHYDEVAQYFIPRKDNIYGQAIKGEKKFNLLYDAEGVRAVDDLAAVLASTMFNPQALWFDFIAKDRSLRTDRVKKWLANSVLGMLEVFRDSNFHTSIIEVLTDLCSIGTSVLRIEPDDEDVLRFYPQTIYQVCVDENNKGLIDTVSRGFCWDKRKILQEYGKDREFIKNKIETLMGEDCNREFSIIHRVSPRHRAERLGNIGTKAMPWASIHVIKELGLTLRESGFEEFPYAVPRWSKLTEEKLGRSPAMKTLSDAKMLQEEKKVFIKGAQLLIGPPLQLPDQGFLTKLKIAPFSSNYRRKGRDKAEPLFTGADPGIGVDMLGMTKEDIRKGFFLDRLNVELGDRATATEVIQKRDENLRVIGPVSNRLDRELIKPIVTRGFGVMFRKGEFGTPPAELQDGAIMGIRYLSMIARAQMIADSENFFRAISATEPMISTQPELLQNIDGDKLFRLNLDKYGIDPNIVRSEAEVKKLREQQQQAIQQQAEREQMLAEGQTIKNIGSVDANRTR